MINIEYSFNSDNTTNNNNYLKNKIIPSKYKKSTF